MADAIAALIGAVVMIGYMYLIVSKLNELPLWIVSIVGLALMVFAFWTDAWRPWLTRNSK